MAAQLGFPLFLFLRFALGRCSVPARLEPGRLRGPVPPLQHRGPLKPSAVGRSVVRYRCFYSSFPNSCFSRLSSVFPFIYQVPRGRLTAHNPGRGSLGGSPGGGPGADPRAGQHLLLQNGARFSTSWPTPRGKGAPRAQPLRRTTRHTYSFSPNDPGRRWTRA